MRAYERDLFSYLCSISDEWHSKTGKSLGLYAAVSPHPNPLPVGEGDKNSLAVAESRTEFLFDVANRNRGPQAGSPLG